MISEKASRVVARWVHIFLAIPIIGYVYSPFEQLPNYAPMTRFVFMPLIALAGLWMWKGHVVRRWLGNKPSNSTT